MNDEQPLRYPFRPARAWTPPVHLDGLSDIPQWIQALMVRTVVASFTILGQPQSKANSREIVPVGPEGNKRILVRKSQAALDYEEQALRQIPPRWRLRLVGPLGVRMRIFYKTELPDLDESLVLDVLQDRYVRDPKTKTRTLVQHGIYRNDRQVRLRIVEHGISKHNPRCEIEVWRLQPAQDALDLPPPTPPPDHNPLLSEAMPAVISDLDIILNDLLSRWHWWATQYLHGRGYSRSEPYATMAPPATGAVWDAPEVRDQHAENVELQEVDHAIDAVAIPWRTALQFNARNLCTGVHVWTSPRLPADPMERAMMVVAARAMLVVELHRREVINGFEVRDILTIQGIDEA